MYTLRITTERYSRTDSGKSWRARPDKTETETLPWHPTSERIGDVAQSGKDKHRKITSDDTLRWFRRIGGSEYAERSYTPVGYIVTRLVSTSPDHEIRHVRTFRITED